MKTFLKIMRHQFGFPKRLNWGYALFLCSIGTLIVYLIQLVCKRLEWGYNSTSLVGFSFIQALLVTFALLLPASTLCIFRLKDNSTISYDFVGKFTGLGPWFLSLLSGFAITLFMIPLHNLSTWIWLKLGKTLIFPTFFFVNDNESILETVTDVFVRDIIPAFGYSVFFLGLMWNCFTDKNKRIGMLIISLSFAVFSLNFVDFIAILCIGLWLCFLRDRTGSIWGPFLALVGAGVSRNLITLIVKSVDITMVQVYSDMDSTYLISSSTAFVIAIVLALVLAKPLNEFKNEYAKNFNVTNEEPTSISILSGVTLSLVVAIVIFAVLWIQMISGI